MIDVFSVEADGTLGSEPAAVRTIRVSSEWETDAVVAGDTLPKIGLVLAGAQKNTDNWAHSFLLVENSVPSETNLNPKGITIDTELYM